MTTTTLNLPENGQLVQVRSRQWIVNDVKPSSLHPSVLKRNLSFAQHLLTLSSVEDDGLGEELQVVWEIEPGARVIEKVALPEPTGLDSPGQTRRLSRCRALGGGFYWEGKARPVAALLAELWKAKAEGVRRKKA